VEALDMPVVTKTNSKNSKINLFIVWLIISIREWRS